MSRATVSFCCAALLAALFAAAPQSSFGETIEIEVVGYVPGTDPALGQGFQTTVDSNPDGTFSLSLGAQAPGPMWQLEGLDIEGDIDPFAALGFAVTNLSGGDLEFTFSVTVPLAPTLPSTLSSGSAGFTLDNSNLDSGATISSNLAGDPLWAGRIDGAPIIEFFTSPFSLTTPVIASFNDQVGPPPIIPGPAATTIGIDVNFTLSAGDSASGTSEFRVIVPEPTSALMLATCVGLIAWRRR